MCHPGLDPAVMCAATTGPGLVNETCSAFVQGFMPSRSPGSIRRRTSPGPDRLHHDDADMMHHMRTTVDLPADVHRRAQRLASERHQSLSATVAELTIRGLASLGESAEISIDPVSGFPVLALGRRVTSEEVADALDDE